MRSSTSSRATLGCGRIRHNTRASSDTSLVFVVRNREDLLTKVIPFFEPTPREQKRGEFLTFAVSCGRWRTGST